MRGSSAYWYKQRQELYAWVNHHVEAGNGAPTLFITLSCAEFSWKDIIERIRERMVVAGEDPSDCYFGSPKLGELVNECSVVVQECFQRRVTTWLETVGRAAFGIKHYFARYEFAPARGQIHVHLLAVPDNHDIFEQCYIDMESDPSGATRARRLSAWASRSCGLTASVDPGFEIIDTNPEPSSMRLSDIDPIDYR